MGRMKARSTANAKSNKSITFWVVGAIALVMAGFIIVMALGSKGNAGDSNTPAASGGLTISTDALSRTPKFYPYRAGGVDMEVIAVKASDGTVRTAFNTCQVCYASGRGYYRLDGNTLVCQNCGNRFSPDQVGITGGGCNPVPITAGDRTEADGQITLSAEFLRQASELFASWKR